MSEKLQCVECGKQFVSLTGRGSLCHLCRKSSPQLGRRVAEILLTRDTEIESLTAQLAAENARMREKLQEAIDHLACMCGEVGVCSECALRVRLSEALAR